MLRWGATAGVLKTPRYSTPREEESVPVGPAVRESSLEVDPEESDKEGE